MAIESFPLERVRAFWFHRQSLARPVGGPIDQVIARSGWLRTLGGVDVYLAARARSPGMTRSDLDAAAQEGRLRVSMAVRGCIYLVPADAVPELLAEATPGWRHNASRDLEKVGSSWKAIDKVAEAVLAALGSQALTTDGIRRALPDGAIKSFGDAGKKAGVSSPLPIALRVLELAGKIERSTEGGRLDTERYLWRVPATPMPAADPDPAARRARIAETFLAHNGPATVAQLGCWTAWSQRDARAALAKVSTATIAVPGLGDEVLVLDRDLDALRATAMAGRGVVSLLSFEDNYLVAHGGPAVVTDAKHHATQVGRWGGSGAGALGNVPHVASRTLLVDGLVAGFWEVDPAAGGGVWTTFEPMSAAVKTTIDAAVDDTARFLLEDVGHARAFSLDTTELVQERANTIKSGRALGKGAAKAAMKPGVAKKPAKTSTKTTRPAAAAAKTSTKKKPAAKAKAAKAKKPAAKKKKR